MTATNQAFSDQDLKELEKAARDIADMDQHALLDLTASEVLELVTEARAWRASQRIGVPSQLPEPRRIPQPA